MPKTTSFASTSPFNVKDGSVQRLSEVTLTSEFSSLSVPTESTVEGIRVIVTGYQLGTQTTPPAGQVRISIDENEDWSSYKNINELSFPSSPGAIGDVSYGSATDLWGKEWTPSDANTISVEFSTTITAYLDAIQVEITYALPPPPGITIQSGLVKLTSGKICINKPI